MRAVLLALTLAGCSSTAPYLATCPALVNYDAAFEARAAAELASLPPGDALKTMIADYGDLREQVRVCRRD